MKRLKGPWQRRWKRMRNNANPDALRRLLRRRFPDVAPSSSAWRWLYPAWWRYGLHVLRHGRFESGATLERATGPSPATRRYLLRIPAAAGIGDQIVTCWSETWLLARQHGLTPVHHPFRSSRHSPGVDWESFLNFGAGEMHLEAIRSDRRLKTVYLPPLDLEKPEHRRIFARIVREVYDRPNVVFHMGTGLYWQSRIDQRDIMPAIYRAKYWRGRQQTVRDIDDSPLRLAVHVRRGDLHNLVERRVGHWRERWIELEYYQTALAQILECLGQRPVSVEIFSDGTERELAPLLDVVSATLFLGEDPRDAFHRMVTADILLPSSSAFAVTAGKISTNIKLIAGTFDSSDFPLYVPNTPDWIRIDRDGTLPARARRQLETALEKRSAGASRLTGLAESS